MGDVAPDHPGPEIVAASAARSAMVLGVDGRSVYGSTDAGDLPLLWTAGLALRGRRPLGTERAPRTTSCSTIGFAGPRSVG